jgi:antitoxin component of MazEF toxin-antitoxin module
MAYENVIKVGRHNTSISVHIPKDICLAMQIDRGDELLITMPEQGLITLSKVTRDPRTARVIY